QLPGGGEYAQRNGQVVERPLLAQVCRREIDGGARPRRSKATVAKSREHTVVGFLHCGVGQSDQNQFGLAGLARVDLDVYELRLDSLQGGGRDDGEHAGHLTGAARTGSIIISPESGDERKRGCVTSNRGGWWSGDSFRTRARPWPVYLKS